MVGERKAPELLDVSERRENGAVKLSGEIDFSGGAIAELEPYHVVPNVPRFKNVKKHGDAFEAVHSSPVMREPARMRIAAHRRAERRARW